MADLDGPRLGAAIRGTARQLVVFLHGYGADGNDLIEIGRAWQQCCRTPRSCRPMRRNPARRRRSGGNGFRSPFASRTSVGAASTKRLPCSSVSSTPNLTRRNLPPSALALVGFSQGTMMALHVGLRRAVAPAAIVGYSGMLVTPNDGPAEAMAAEIKSRPPVLLVHGDSDELIPVQALLHVGAGARRARSTGRMAYVGRHRPRHRPRRLAPRRRVSGKALRPRAKRRYFGFTVGSPPG